MTEIQLKNCTELIHLLSCHDAETEEVEEMLSLLDLALTNPKKYFHEHPDDLWLAEGFNLEAPDKKLSENIFSWSLSEALVNFVVIGENPHELCDGVMEVLYDMDIHIKEPEYELESWLEYADFIEKQLLKKKTGKTLVTLDINFSNDLSVFVIESSDHERVLGLAQFFNLKVVTGS